MLCAYRTTASLFFAAGIALASGAAAQIPSDGPFEGSFASGRLAVELHQSGEQLSGTVTMNGAACPLRGSIQTDRFTAEFELDGQTIPLEAGLEGQVLIVTSGGVTHRLVRQVIDGNPLTDPALSQPSPAVTAPFPQVLTLASGATIRFPEGWTTQPMGRFVALLPGSAAGQAMYAANSIPWPESLDASTTEGSDRLMTVIGQFVPGLTREGDPEQLSDSPSDGVRIRLVGQTVSGQASTFVALARRQSDAMALILGMGDDSALQADAPMLQEMLATVQPAPKVALDESTAGPFNASQLLDMLRSVLAARTASESPPLATDVPTAGVTDPAPEAAASPAESLPPPAEPSQTPETSAPPTAAPPASVPDQTPPPPASKAAPPRIAKPPVLPPTTAAPVSAPTKSPAPTRFAPIAPPPKLPPAKFVSPSSPSPSPARPSIPSRANLGGPPQLIAPAKAPVDPAVFGIWHHSESHISGTATLAIETVYQFKPDGTFTLGSRSAGGDAHNSLSSGFKVGSTGTWTASAGVLKTINKEGKVFQINYLFHEGQLVFKRGPGKYTFWSR